MIDIEVIYDYLHLFLFIQMLYVILKYLII